LRRGHRRSPRAPAPDRERKIILEPSRDVFRWARQEEPNMTYDNDRRAFLRLTGVGGLVFASGLAGCAHLAGRGRAPDADFFFLPLPDTHWGFKGAPNPEAAVPLPPAIEEINASAVLPDFIVFTGDLTHTTDDPAERRRRMASFKQHVASLKVKNVYF